MRSDGPKRRGRESSKQKEGGQRLQMLLKGAISWGWRSSQVFNKKVIDDSDKS